MTRRELFARFIGALVAVKVAPVAAPQGLAFHKDAFALVMADLPVTGVLRRAEIPFTIRYLTEAKDLGKVDAAIVWPTVEHTVQQ